MKAETKVQAKPASLPDASTGWLPFLQRHGNKLLIALILIMLVIILLRNRRAATAQRRALAETSLSSAESAIYHLRTSPDFMMTSSEAQLAAMRDAAVVTAQGGLDDAAKYADESDLRARLEIDRGDLNWALANFPALPGAVTQESLRSKKQPSEYLAAAQSAYEQALKDPLSQNLKAVTAARLGLAAIDENKGEWDDASKRYQEVVDDPRADKALSDYARERQLQLASLKKPVLLASGVPSTQPSPFIVPEAPTSAPTGILGPGVPGSTSRPLKFSDVFPNEQPATATTSPIAPLTSTPGPAPTTAPSTRPSTGG